MSTTTNRQVLGKGHYLQLVNVNGWEYVERTGVTGIVAIVAVTGDRRIVLVEQPRPAIGPRVIELPAGLAGDIPGQEDEDLAEAARRELLEETGYSCADMVPLTAAGPPSSGATDEMVTLYGATGLTKVGEGGGDATEAIVVYDVPLTDAVAWLQAREVEGAVVDPKVYAGLYFAASL
jgi:ADP-ribose pyrophosphatase